MTASRAPRWPAVPGALLALPALVPPAARVTVSVAEAVPSPWAWALQGAEGPPGGSTACSDAQGSLETTVYSVCLAHETRIGAVPLRP